MDYQKTTYSLNFYLQGNCKRQPEKRLKYIKHTISKTTSVALSTRGWTWYNILVIDNQNPPASVPILVEITLSYKNTEPTSPTSLEFPPMTPLGPIEKKTNPSGPGPTDPGPYPQYLWTPIKLRIYYRYIGDFDLCQ